MRTLRAVLVRLWGWRGRMRREREWAAEFESHLALDIEDNIRAGMTPEEAAREARLKFGGVEAVTEAMRDRAGIRWVETTWQDVRYAARGLRRAPAFAAAAIGSLTLGLGAALAVFTVADHLLVRPLPYADSSRLVMLWESQTKGRAEHSEAAPGNYLDWKSQNDVLEGLAGLREGSSVLADGDQVEELSKQRVTADFFGVLGVKPARGRVFTEEEDRAAISGQAVVLISYRLWQRRYGGTDTAIGRKVLVDSVPRTIIGVLPASFYFLHRGTDLWEPLGLNPNGDNRQSQGRWMFCIGRLRRGVTVEQAQAHMGAVAARLEAAYPVFNHEWTVQVEPLRDAMLREVKTSLWVLLGAVGMMLAVACANVANLLLARYGARRREMAVRASIGASRGRVVRQLLTESVLLSTAGGMGGVLLARWAVTALAALAPYHLAAPGEMQMDGRILAAAWILSLLTGVLFGLAPAMVTSRLDLTGALRGGNRPGLGAGGRLRAWLVGAEVALSVVLLAGALLLFRSLVGLETVPSGMDPSNVLTFRVSLPPARYPAVAARRQFFERALEEIGHLPGVRSAGAVSFPPFSGHGTGTFVTIEGRAPAKPGEELLALVRTVTPGYFSTLRIPLEAGRDFTEADNQESSPRRALVNEAFARQFLRGENPLGKKIHLYLMEPADSYAEIIGVAGNLREWSMDREPMPTVYYAEAHLSRSSMIFLVRAAADAMQLAEASRRVVQRLDAAQPIAEVRTMEEILGDDLARQRFSAWLLAGFSAVAVTLAGVGIYGLLAYAVAARRSELGLRAALGADAGRLVALVLRMGAGPVAGGLAAGAAGALGLTGLLKSLLFGIAPRDPATLVGAPLLLALVALAAACVPARRAAMVDPMETLRAE